MARLLQPVTLLRAVSNGAIQGDEPSHADPDAGFDQISTFRKMHVLEKPGERELVLLSAGKLDHVDFSCSLILGGQIRGEAVRLFNQLEPPVLSAG